MSHVAIRLEEISKRFRKGESHDSLRDLLPALARRVTGARRRTPTDRDFWALRDVSFDVAKGEAFAVVGSNGAGKSTLLKLLSRIVPPTSGRLSVDGRLAALIEVSAGFHPDLTGRENIYLNGSILGMTRNDIKRRFDEIVAFAELEEFIDTPVKRYSSGMYARLGFAIAAHVNAEVLLVDEVLSVGDYMFQQKCLGRMREVLASGATVLFVSHNLKTVSELCGRAALLERGRLLAVGRSQDIIQRYLTRAAKPRPSEDRQAYISQVCLRNARGEAMNFQSGETAWIDVEIAANERCDKLAIGLFMLDGSHYEVFNTSTERLGFGNFSLAAGQRYRCTFQVRLNAANGTFYPSVSLYRYDIQKEYDRLSPAATAHITSDVDVRGAVNCFPRVVHQEIVGVAETVVVPQAVGIRR